MFYVYSFGYGCTNQIANLTKERLWILQFFGALSKILSPFLTNLRNVGNIRQTSNHSVGFGSLSVSIVYSITLTSMGVAPLIWDLPSENPTQIRTIL